MKAKSLFLGLIILGTLMTSCDYERIRVSDTVTTREVQLSEYSGIRVSDAFNAYVTFSDSQERIEIEANDNLHERIIVRKEGNVLIVRLKNLTNVKGNATMNVYITTNNLSYFDISGASSLLLENELSTQEVDIELSGASTFTGEIYADELKFDAGGASRASLFGTLGFLDVSLSGSSTIDDYDLETEKLDIRLSGASDAYLTVSESIDIKASGASTLRYKGEAVIYHKDLSGASEIIKKD